MTSRGCPRPNPDLRIHNVDRIADGKGVHVSKAGREDGGIGQSRRVGGQHHVVQFFEWVVFRQRLLVEYVESRATQLAALERRHQGVGVHEGTEHSKLRAGARRTSSVWINSRGKEIIKPG